MINLIQIMPNGRKVKFARSLHAALDSEALSGPASTAAAQVAAARSAVNALTASQLSAAPEGRVQSEASSVSRSQSRTYTAFSGADPRSRVRLRAIDILPQDQEAFSVADQNAKAAWRRALDVIKARRGAVPGAISETFVDEKGMPAGRPALTRQEIEAGFAEIASRVIPSGDLRSRTSRGSGAPGVSISAPSVASERGGPESSQPDATPQGEQSPRLTPEEAAHRAGVRAAERRRIQPATAPSVTNPRDRWKMVRNLARATGAIRTAEGSSQAQPDLGPSEAAEAASQPVIPDTTDSRPMQGALGALRELQSAMRRRERAEPFLPLVPDEPREIASPNMPEVVARVVEAPVNTLPDLSKMWGILEEPIVPNLSPTTLAAQEAEEDEQPIVTSDIPAGASSQHLTQADPLSIESDPVPELVDRTQGAISPTRASSERDVAIVAPLPPEVASPAPVAQDSGALAVAVEKRDPITLAKEFIELASNEVNKAKKEAEQAYRAPGFNNLIDEVIKAENYLTLTKRLLEDLAVSQKDRESAFAEVEKALERDEKSSEVDDALLKAEKADERFVKLVTRERDLAIARKEKAIEEADDIEISEGKGSSRYKQAETRVLQEASRLDSAEQFLLELAPSQQEAAGPVSQAIGALQVQEPSVPSVVSHAENAGIADPVSQAPIDVTQVAGVRAEKLPDKTKGKHDFKRVPELPEELGSPLSTHPHPTDSSRLGDLTRGGVSM